MPSSVEMSPRKWTSKGAKFAAEVLEFCTERTVSEEGVGSVKDAGCQGEWDVPAPS